MKLRKFRMIVFVLFLLFHLLLVSTLDYDFILKKANNSYKNNYVYILSCYAIIATMLSIFLIGMINGISEGKSISFVKHMALPFGSSLIVDFMYYEMNLYGQNRIVTYMALLCLWLSVSVIFIFLCVSVINKIKKQNETHSIKIYKSFFQLDILFLVVTLIGGFEAMNHTRGENASTILLIIVHSTISLSILAIWSAIMWVIYKMIDRLHYR